MTAVFLRILGFVILITLFYGGIGQWWLTQSEEHPPPELQITVETDTDTLVTMGETLLEAKGGCLLCHKITEQGNERGPDLRGVGGRAAKRRPGMDSEAYLMESLVDPGAYVVAEFAAAGGTSIMPAANQPPAEMSPTELKALVAYLQSLGGEITVEITAEDVRAAEAQKQKPAAGIASNHPGAALLTKHACVGCHDVTGTTRRVGPPLTNVADRLSAAEIRQSILEPDAVTAEGYPPGMMLQDFGERLTPEELDQLVGYLSGQVSLGERLSHPGVNLAILILIFNGGVLLAMQRAPGGKPSWAPVALLLGGAAVFIAFYLVTSSRSPKPAAPEPAAEAVVVETTTAVPVAPVAALDGQALYSMTCPACHGPNAQGVPGLGKDMTTSEFIRSQSDEELVAFIKVGRTIDDPLNTTGVPMPPMGANPALTDAELLAIVEFIRSLRN